MAIGAFTPDSPSQAACFEVGDTYLSIAGESVQGPQPDRRVREASLKHLGETVPIVVERKGEAVQFQMKLNEQPPALGVGFAPEQNYIEVSPIDAIVEGVKWPLVQTQRQLAGLASMITGKSKGEVGGPSAIVKTIKGSVDSGVIAFLTMAALISTVLGLFNILPLPALDGGRLMFMFYEVIFRRPAQQGRRRLGCTASASWRCSASSASSKFGPPREP